MLDLSNFDLVFSDLSPFPFTRQWAQQVEKKRKEYGGLLFLDRVLGALNLAKGELQPMIPKVWAMLTLDTHSSSLKVLPSQDRQRSPPAAPPRL